MKYKYILFFIILLTACREKREVKPTFYYWKTTYSSNQVENSYLSQFKSNKLYVRIMDVDLDAGQKTIPVAPVNFKSKVPQHLQLIPVVYIVNKAIKEQTEAQLTQLAHNILWLVKAKIVQAGKFDYDELQIDCDWTVATRNNYFFLLNAIKKFNSGRILSTTLRLHQVKNQLSSGIPPVHKVMLMCYNMGNLRKYGAQNSILDVSEFKKYVNANLTNYPLPVDIALPLFSWSVVFEGSRFAGISKRITLNDLENKTMFATASGLFTAKSDLPQFGIKKNQQVRYEASKLEDVKSVARYLSDHLSARQINIAYYHLDQQILKTFPIHELEEINYILR